MRPAWEAAKELCRGRAAIGVEVGVCFGANAEEVFQQFPNISLIGVDDYSEEPQRRPGMLELLKRYAFTYMPQSSVEAARLLKDQEFDIVYIDADHTYEGVKADLEAWYGLVKKGGIFGGHDYDNTSVPGVKKAVDEFAAKHGLKLIVLPGQGTADWFVYV